MIDKVAACASVLTICAVLAGCTYTTDHSVFPDFGARVALGPRLVCKDQSSTSPGLTTYIVTELRSPSAPSGFKYVTVTNDGMIDWTFTESSQKPALYIVQVKGSDGSTSYVFFDEASMSFYTQLDTDLATAMATANHLTLSGSNSDTVTGADPNIRNFLEAVAQKIVSGPAFTTCWNSG